MTSLTIPLRSQAQAGSPGASGALAAPGASPEHHDLAAPDAWRPVYFDAFRTAMSYPPFWFVRCSVILNHLVPDLSLFATGVAAWAGSTRGTAARTVDLVTIAARPRWRTRARLVRCHQPLGGTLWIVSFLF